MHLYIHSRRCTQQMFNKHAQDNKHYYNKQNQLTTKWKILFNCRDKCLNKSTTYCSARMSFMESSYTTCSRKQCIVKLTLGVHLNRQQLWHVTKLDLGLSTTTSKQASECNITPSESLAAGCTKTGWNILLSVSCDSNVCVNSIWTQHSVSPAIDSCGFHERKVSVSLQTLRITCRFLQSTKFAFSHVGHSFTVIHTINTSLVERWLKNTRQVKQACSRSIQSHMKSESILIMCKCSAHW